MVAQEVEGLTAQVRARFDAKGVHLARRYRSNAMKSRDQQVRYERFSIVGHDGELAVRLLLIRGKLSEELVVGDPGRSSELGFVVNAFPYFLGRRPCGHPASEIIGHVEVSFIKRERLDQRGVVRENRMDLS